jgi:membrane protease YdiL (CAAX protease family)
MSLPSPPLTEPLAPLEPFHAPAPVGERLSPLQRRLLAVGEVVLCSSVPTQFLIGALLVAAGWAHVNEATGTTELTLPFVLTLSLADTFVVIVLMFVLMRAHGESARELWIGTVRLRREVLVGMLLVPAVFLMVVVMLNGLRLFAPSLHNVISNPLERLAGNTPVDAAMFGLVAILAGGVREELQRAFVLHRFDQHLGGANVGVLVSSVAFGLGHYTQGWDAVITTGALGFFWALLYLDRRSSVAPVVSHAGFNSLEILRVALVGQ